MKTFPKNQRTNPILWYSNEKYRRIGSTGAFQPARRLWCMIIFTTLLFNLFFWGRRSLTCLLLFCFIFRCYNYIRILLCQGKQNSNQNSTISVEVSSETNLATNSGLEQCYVTGNSDKTIFLLFNHFKNIKYKLWYFWAAIPWNSTVKSWTILMFQQPIFVVGRSRVFWKMKRWCVQLLP